MATKTSALKRPASNQSTGSWDTQPARMEALTPTNIEQAADLGAGYVIVKLRDTAKSRRSAIVNSPTPTEIPVLSRERIEAALQHFRTVPAEAKRPHKRPADNEAFLRNMAHQEQARRAELAASGQLIGGQELAERLEISPQAISKALKAGRLFALEGAGGRLLYPAFYADGKVSRRTLETVTRALGDIPPSSKWQFFTTPKGSLDGVTPLEALQQGARQAVMVTAAGFVER